MHTDRKIGFAMGILLIGIVAALFFRNEPLLSTRVSGVRREKELNKELRQRDVAVYLDENESDNATDPSAESPPWTLRDFLRNVDERNKTAPVPVGAKSFASRSLTSDDEELLDGYRPSRNRKKAEPLVQAKPDSSAQPGGGPFDSLSKKSNRNAFSPLPPLIVVDSADPVEDSVPAPRADPGTSKDKPSSEFQPPETFDEYVVKYGDTLSGIAQRMLGAQSKYMEIYNANRDRIASPDRLDVGKPLRIPRVAAKERPTF